MRMKNGQGYFITVGKYFKKVIEEWDLWVIN